MSYFPNPVDVRRHSYHRRSRWALDSFQWTKPPIPHLYRGACSDNGGLNARGGCAFIYKTDSQHPRHGCEGFPLEARGPTGELHMHNSNRAELRAVVAVVRYRHWDSEGFKSLVIATDSEYVVKGATEGAKVWVRNGWKTTSGADVKNLDLWECLLGEVEAFDKDGLRVQFCRIPRQWKVEADHRANKALHGEPWEYFSDIHGILT